MLWLSRLDCTELTWLGKPRCLYGEKLTRLVGVANRFFGIRDLRYSKLGIRDLKENSELKVCAGGGIPKITLGITGLENYVGIVELKPHSNLSKTHRCCCRALVHFHFSAFSSIFSLNWTAKQSVFFRKTIFQHANSRLQIFARCRPFLGPLSRSWPTRKSAGCLSLMPDSSDPYRYFGTVKRKLKLKVTRRGTKIH